MSIFSSAKLVEIMDWQGRRTDWLAGRLQVDVSYVSKLRSGAKPITAKLAVRICEILDVPISTLAYNVTDPERVA